MLLRPIYADGHVSQQELDLHNRFTAAGAKSLAAVRPFAAVVIAHRHANAGTEGAIEARTELLQDLSTRYSPGTAAVAAGLCLMTSVRSSESEAASRSNLKKRLGSMDPAHKARVIDSISSLDAYGEDFACRFGVKRNPGLSDALPWFAQFAHFRADPTETAVSAARKRFDQDFAKLPASEQVSSARELQAIATFALREQGPEFVRAELALRDVSGRVSPVAQFQSLVGRKGTVEDLRS